MTAQSILFLLGFCSFVGALAWVEFQHIAGE
jgi:hypothetical protein